MPEIPEFQIARLALAPSDILVVRVPKGTNPHVCDGLRGAILETLRKSELRNQCLVFSEECALEVLAGTAPEGGTV